MWRAKCTVVLRLEGTVNGNETGVGHDGLVLAGSGRVARSSEKIVSLDINRLAGQHWY